MNAVLRHLPTVLRILLGLIFFVFGLNGFLQFLPMPPLSGPPADFMGALVASGYMFPMIKGVEVVAGALLLGGRFVPLALVLLAPIVVNIAAYHVFLAPESMGMVVFLLFAEAYLAWAYRDSFRGVLAAGARPVAS